MRADINVAHLSRLLPALAAITVLLLSGCDTSTRSQPLDQTLVRKAGPGADLSAGDANAWLDGIVPTLLEREGVAGTTISIVHRGNVITERGYGLSDTGISTGHPSPVSADTTLFRIGSVSKTITATAVMQLVQSGHLDLDQPIDNYLDFQLPRTYSTPITLRHLLTHTAGFEDQIKGVIGAPDEPVPSLRDTVSVDPPSKSFSRGRFLPIQTIPMLSPDTSCNKSRTNRTRITSRSTFFLPQAWIQQQWISLCPLERMRRFPTVTNPAHHSRSRSRWSAQHPREPFPRQQAV